MANNPRRPRTPLESIFNGDLFNLGDLGKNLFSPEWQETFTSVRTTFTEKPLDEDSDTARSSSRVTADGKLIARADMPGVSREGLAVTVKGDKITATGARPTFDSGAVETLTVTWIFADVDPHSVKASIKDGLITVKASRLNSSGAEEFAVPVE